MYRHRQRYMSWSARRQMGFAGKVWAIHILVFALLVLALWYWQ